MDSYDILGKFANEYVADLRAAKNRDDWEDMRAIRMQAKRIAWEMGQIVKSVDLLERYGLTVS